MATNKLKKTTNKKNFMNAAAAMRYDDSGMPTVKKSPTGKRMGSDYAVAAIKNEKGNSKKAASVKTSAANRLKDNAKSKGNVARCKK